MNKIDVYLNTLRQKGYLAYEYHPFHNYLTSVDLYERDGFIIPDKQAVNKKNGLILKKINNKWVDNRGNIIPDGNVITYDNNTKKLYEAGSLIDFETDKLNFDLNHPVEIEVLPSYDGSVNLILNDNKNIPRLINSRFSAREKNTYEIVDRIGENDTNIYNSETFDKDTSLYFLYEQNPIIEYRDTVSGGNLLSGTYCFYFTYCDADDNESDIIAESGVIPVFLGTNGYPTSMEGGIKNINTYKQIKLKLTNLDKSYNYFKIYYVRYFADYGQNKVVEGKKIYLKYPIKSHEINIQITGNEECEDIDPNLLNITKFNPKSILTQAQCKNMLFFGNIVKNTDNYRELLDCALRIIPTLKEDYIKQLGNNYNINGNDGAYYNSSNIYNKTGYFTNEYYRFGVVFIYKDGTLSNVYNTLGTDVINTTYKSGSLYDNSNEVILKRKYITIDDYGWIRNASEFFDNSGNYLNSKGVCKFEKSYKNDEAIFGIKFNIPEEVKLFLKEELNIRGLFFVRLKRIPNILAQCYLLPFDEVLQAPIIENTNNETTNYYTECFVTQGKELDLIWNSTSTKTNILEDRIITNNYSERLYKYEDKDNVITNSRAYAAICPDFLLNQPYYNLIFNSSTFVLEQITEEHSLKLDLLLRHFIAENTYIENDFVKTKATICSVTEDVPVVAINNITYRLKVGETEESFKYKFAEINKSDRDDIEDNTNATNIVRGMYSPYLAVYSESELKTGALYNIYLENSGDIKQEFLTRMNSSEPFYAISNRYNFESLTEETEETKTNYSLVCWRGDCYINRFTYRLNRNFNDPSLPNNDVIIDRNTWKDNYNAENPEEWDNISRSDLNAVLMGNWITFNCRSYMNYALRSLDHSYVSEEALMGSPRTYFPKSRNMYLGEYKMPDSYVYNDAYRTSLGFKCYFTLQDINYIKNTFSNRIQYSAIAIQDSFKNNYRMSLSTYFRDYSLEYGSILKLISFEGYLLVIFEHAIGLAVINERVLAGSGDGEPVFINTLNVLPEELTIISDTYGTQWGESVIKSEAGYVYGVDTIAKKIWRVKGQLIEIISDFKVNKFLIDNISLGERELYPIIGLKNVKTHYNNNKKDIMFTFYDDIYKDEEKVWNLCYNELLEQFVTFYSWIPSYSANIDTKFFTFNRNTSKELTLLNFCNYNNPNNIGVLLDYPIIENKDSIIDLHYIVNQTNSIKSLFNDDYKISLDKLEIKSEYLTYKIEKDHFLNWKYFKYDENNYLENNRLILKEDIDLNELYKTLKERNSNVLLLEITPEIIGSIDDNDKVLVSTLNYRTETVAVTFKDIVENNKGTNSIDEIPDFTTDFYLHGSAGIFDVVEPTIYPTYWYGEYHPFEFEFVVNNELALLKIFNNLVIISNKAEPESFHFEIEGDNYDFSEDKRTMYFRLESTKELYLNLGSNILFNRNYTDVVRNKDTYELYYRTTNKLKLLTGESDFEKEYNYSKMDKVYPVYSHGLVQQVKSTIFPLYYERIDTYNDIYHKYHLMKDDDGMYDFQNLSGSEIAWNKDMNQFNIVTHIKNSPINHVGRLRGNSMYKEGKWNIQIPSITFMLKNEFWNKAIGKSIILSCPLNISDYTLCDKKYVLCGGTEYMGEGINTLPPLVINSQEIPKDLETTEVSNDKLPNIYSKFGYNIGAIEVDKWTNRKETKIRDKWMKIRVRYSGKNLAIIHSIATLYNISYS